MRLGAHYRKFSLRLLAVLAIAAAAGACNAGQAEQRAAVVGEPEHAATGTGPQAASPAPMPATAKPAPPAAGASTQVVPEADKGRACNTDADCAVKDVGSCCGYRPQCLNKDTPTFPDQVKAQCAREGRVSTCGVMAVSACQCVSGRCENLLQSDESMPAAPAPLQ